jgi:hypothetical protein
VEDWGNFVAHGTDWVQLRGGPAVAQAATPLRHPCAHAPGGCQPAPTHLSTLSDTLGLSPQPLCCPSRRRRHHC